MVALLDRLHRDASGPSGGSSGDAQQGVGSSAAGRRQPFATAGGPWEFNLRDLLRWCDLIESSVAPGDSTAAAAAEEMEQMDVDHQQQEQQQVAAGDAEALKEAAEHFAGMLLFQRLRTDQDRDHARAVFARIWGRVPRESAAPQLLVDESELVVGTARLPRGQDGGGAGAGGGEGARQQQLARAATDRLSLPAWQAPLLESAAHCAARGWMCLLVGGAGAGKTSVARLLAALAGRPLLELVLTTGTDTSDLLGSFEQVEPARRVQEIADAAGRLVSAACERLLLSADDVNGGGGRRLALARSLQEAWAAYERGLMSAGAAAAAGGAAGSQSMEDTEHQLQLAGRVIAALQQVVSSDLPEISDHEISAGAQPSIADALAAVAADAAAVQAELSAPGGRSTAGRFEWVDGSLTRAVERGGWVLLDNANLCNPTVLDRLNPLLEPGGVLQLSEAGGGADAGGRVIVPHPDFRLFLCLDPRMGEVSRAMRNRGIEVFLLPPGSVTGGGAGAGGAAGGAEQVGLGFMV
jgi:midasin